MLPVDGDGNIDTERLNRRLDAMRNEERELSRGQNGPVVPVSRDCVLGRGYPFQNFPGNVHLSRVVRLNQSAYVKLKRNQKMAMVQGVVDYVRGRNGRFLKRIDDSSKPHVSEELRGRWVVVGDDEARTKVGHVFRTKTTPTGDTDDGEELRIVSLAHGTQLRVPVDASANGDAGATH